MNKLMTKTQALKIIAKEYHHLSDFSRLMISSDAVNSGEIMNFCGEQKTVLFIFGVKKNI